MPNFTISIPISHYRIADIITNGLEGGANYWLVGWKMAAPDMKGKRTAPNGYAWYSVGETYDMGNLTIVAEWIEDESTGKTARKSFGVAAITEGLKVLAVKVPHQFAAILSEDDDATTGDCLLQCIIFGEVIFG